jgi:sensor histidine kinase YesM
MPEPHDMMIYEFIFSNKPYYRLCRHFTFWLAFSLHFIIQNLLIGGFKEAQHYRSFFESLYYISFFLPFYMVSSYIFMYTVLPRFLFQRRFAAFFVFVLCLLVFDFIACYLSGAFYIHFTSRIPVKEVTMDINKYQAIVNGIWLPVVVFGLTGGIRVTKKWYLQQKENEKLLKTKVTTELQFLKIQIHPRFLLHSLNSLKDHLLIDSSDAPGLILKLSDLLSYILYESDRDCVLLDKEIDILRDYIAVEKNNYTDRLDDKIEIHGDTDGIYIAPLLLLPFVEIGFDSLAMKKNKNQSITVVINIENNMLHFELICITGSSSQDYLSKDPEWAGLKKRLQNLYPHDHRLEIVNGIEKLSVNLKITYIKPTMENKTAGSIAINDYQ